MKKYLIPVIVLVVAAAVVAATGVERVPEGFRAVSLSDPDAAPLEAGTHFVGPFAGKRFVVPSGIFERRYPEVGPFAALSVEGTAVGAIVLLRLRIMDASVLYAEFGADYEARFAGIVRDAVELDLAGRQLDVGSPAPEDFAQAIAADVKSSFGAAGVAVAAIKIDEWQVGAPDEVPRASVTRAPIRKIIFVGADGADWMVIDRLITEGRLPNFKRLVANGATGVLQSMDPMLSPLLWTTMATGKMPEHHGILNFTVFDNETGKRMPITRLSRKVDAFWNMLSDYDRSVSVLGWLATFPAEDINGVMVTDRVGYLAFADAGEDGVPDHAITPAARVDELSQFVVNGSTANYDEFARFIALSEQEFFRARSVAFDPRDPVNNMIMLYATAETFRAMSLHVVDRDAPDFLAVYYELVDATGHLFMHYAPPKRPEVSQEKYDRYHNAVDEAYVLQDEMLGEMMDRLDDNTVLMVVSDHGWKSGELRPKVSPEIWGADAVRWHRKQGIVAFYGNGVRRGYRTEDFDLADVAPTILALQGFPRVADMPGRVMGSAFDDSVQARFKTDRVPTLERERDVDITLAAAEAGDAEALKKLEALGYITPENPFAHNNLGQRYLDEGRLQEAVVEFNKALELQPTYSSALNNLGVAYGRLRQYDKAEAALRRALEINPEDLYAVNNIAVMYVERGRSDVALEWAKRAIELEPNYANGHITLGSIYAQLGRFEDAEASFEHALRVDPGNARATSNLEKVRQDRTRSGQ